MIPKYEAIAADIRRSIEDGALKPGDKLPTVVEFCELYSVSKITVKRAIEQITEEGLVTSRRGSGTYVKDTAGLPDQAFFQGKNDRAQGFSYEHRGEKVTSVVYDFSIGNPSVPAPELVRETMLELLDMDPVALHAYSPAAGLPEVKEAIAAYLSERYDTTATPTNSAKNSSAKP